MAALIFPLIVGRTILALVVLPFHMLFHLPSTLNLFRKGGIDFVMAGAPILSSGPAIRLERRGGLSVLRIKDRKQPIVLRNGPARSSAYFASHYRLSPEMAMRLAALLREARKSTPSRSPRIVGVVDHDSSLTKSVKVTVQTNHRRAPVRVLFRAKAVWFLGAGASWDSYDLSGPAADLLIHYLENAIAEHQR